MPVIFDPSRIVNKVLPHNAGDLVTKDLNFKQKFKTALSRLDWLSDRDIIKSIDKSMSFYRKKAKELQLEGEKPAEAKADALNGGKLLNARLSDLIVSKASEDVKEKYSGQKYIWLPSDAEEIDPVHALNYGKTFTIGEGEMPGERYGCRCGMEILTNDIYEAPGIYKLGATSGAQKRAEMQRQGQAAVSKEIVAKEKQIAENEAKIKQALKENAPKQQDLPLKTETPLNLASVTPANAGVSVHSIKSALPTQLFTTEGKLIDYEKWITTPFAVKKFFNAINFKKWNKTLTGKEIETFYNILKAEYGSDLGSVSQSWIEKTVKKIKAVFEKKRTPGKSISDGGKPQAKPKDASKSNDKSLSVEEQFQALGVKQDKPMSAKEAVKNTNPHFAESIGHQTNCTYCVAVNELRRRGFKVTAMPKNKANKEIETGAECFENPQIIGIDNTTNMGQLMPLDVIERLIAYPDNARFGILIIKKNDMEGHTFVCEKVKGRLKFYDPQNPNNNAEKIFLEETYRAAYYRMDGLQLNGDIDWGKVIEIDKN